MKIVITCGPAYESVDGVRRLTNLSTGKLGITMANYFTDLGHEVLCLKGEGSTCCDPCRAGRIEPFGTNDDLLRVLVDLSRSGGIDAIFHAAALCDYRVEEVFNSAGESVTSRKFATRDGRLQLILAPAVKVLPRLRALFPQSQIIGWKYELAGTREEAFDKAWRQIEECRTESCVLNGAAYGPGFALCQRAGSVLACADAPALCKALGAMLGGKAE